MLRAIFAVFATVCVLLLVPARVQAGETQPELKIGQVWSIKSPVPTTAKVVIGKLETWNGKAVVHVSLLDVPTPSDLPKAGGPATVAHAPFERAALVGSLDKLVASDQPIPADFATGVEQWQAANGGVWTVGVADVIKAMFDTIRKSGN